VVCGVEEGMMDLLLLCAVGVYTLLFLSVFILLAKRRRKTFEKRFPPISEAEFVARCRPGTDPKVALKVRRIIADSLGVDYERVYPSSRFVEDLGAD
jgi:hypothetical protein